MNGSPRLSPLPRPVVAGRVAKLQRERSSETRGNVRRRRGDEDVTWSFKEEAMNEHRRHTVRAERRWTPDNNADELFRDVRPSVLGETVTERSEETDN